MSEVNENIPYSHLIRRTLQEKSREFVFVIGCARSGTTILFDYLNDSPDIFLLNEDNAFLPNTSQDFWRSYNARWRQAGRNWTKGYTIPHFCVDCPFWFDVYLQLKNNFNLAGSKIAFSPLDDGYWNTIDNYCIPFFSEYFGKAQYLLTVRRPSENVLSMMKLFPQLPFGTAKNAWIKSFQTQIILYSSLFRSRFVFHHTINLDMMKELCSAMGTTAIDKSNDYFQMYGTQESFIIGNNFDQITINDSEKNELIELEKAWRFFCKDVDEQTGRARQAVHIQELSRLLWSGLERLRERPDAPFEWPG